MYILKIKEVDVMLNFVDCGFFKCTFGYVFLISLLSLVGGSLSSGNTHSREAKAKLLMLWYGSDYIACSLGVLDVVILCCIFLRYGMSLENWVLGDVWLLICCGLCLRGL
jgi:hypothetical protein